MSFQQQLNQALYVGVAAKGFYERSPAGELKRLSKAYEQADIKRAEWDEPLEGEEELARIYSKEQFDRAQRIYELNPTLENLQKAREESKALAALNEEYNTKTKQKKAFKERKSILLDKYGEKMEVKENGK